MNINFIKKAFTFFICGSLIFNFASVSYAFARDNDSISNDDELSVKIEESSKKYDEAIEKRQDLMNQIKNNEEKISYIEEKLPSQQVKVYGAIRELYDFNSNLAMLLNWILGIEDLTTAIKNFDYLQFYRGKNMAILNEMSDMKRELDDTNKTLSDQKQEVEHLANEAKQSLDEATALREQRIEEARKKAEAEKLAAQEAIKQAQNEQNSNEDNSGNNNSEPSSPPQPVTPPTPDISIDGDKNQFINHWAARIDAFMTGYPLFGYGRIFAEAAWDYGVDPRYSPAISHTESTRGLHCFLPYNAWGWGNYSYSSWEEAIRSHVRGLSRGYSYTLTVEDAKKYCPPTWQAWYSRTSAALNSI